VLAGAAMLVAAGTWSLPSLAYKESEQAGGSDEQPSVKDIENRKKIAKCEFFKGGNLSRPYTLEIIMHFYF